MTVWRAYYRTLPVDPLHAELRAAIQAALTVNANPFRSGQPAAASDFSIYLRDQTATAESGSDHDLRQVAIARAYAMR